MAVLGPGWSKVRPSRPCQQPPPVHPLQASFRIHTPEIPAQNPDQYRFRSSPHFKFFFRWNGLIKGNYHSVRRNLHSVSPRNFLATLLFSTIYDVWSLSARFVGPKTGVYTTVSPGFPSLFISSAAILLLPCNIHILLLISLKKAFLPCTTKPGIFPWTSYKLSRQ